METTHEGKTGTNRNGKVIELKPRPELQIRAACAYDILEVGIMLVEQKSIPDFDLNVFLKEWMASIDSTNYVMLVAYDGDKLAGALGGVFTNAPFSSTSWLGYELFWLVVEEYRLIGQERLLDNFEGWVKERGGSRVVLHVPSGSVQYRDLGLVEKHGFLTHEIRIVKILTEGGQKLNGNITRFIRFVERPQLHQKHFGGWWHHWW